MSDSEETLNNQNSAVLKAIADLSARMDIQLQAINQKLEEHDIQFEAIRIGIVANSAAFDRLQAKILNSECRCQRFDRRSSPDSERRYEGNSGFKKVIRAAEQN